MNQMISEEFLFLISILRSILQPSEMIDFNRSEGALDREELVRLISRNGLRALIYHHLNPRFMNNALMSDLFIEMRKTVHFETARGFLLLSELLRLNDSFAAADLPFISLKGPALSMMAYGDAFSRFSSDLDIWVKPETYHRAADQLREIGYQSEKYESSQRNIEGGRSSHYVFRNERKGVAIELHWKLFQRQFDPDYDELDLWNRRQSVRVSDAPIPGLCLEDLSLYLCMHGSKHGWSRLSWICDLAFLMHLNPRIDWKTVIERGVKWRCHRRLTLGLGLVQRLFEISVPAAFLNSIQPDDGISRIIDEALQCLSESFSYSDHPSRYNSLDRFNMRSFDNGSDRFRYQIYAANRMIHSWLAPSEKDKRWISLPNHFHFAYSFIRPLRIANDGIRTIRKKRESRHESAD